MNRFSSEMKTTLLPKFHAKDLSYIFCGKGGKSNKYMIIPPSINMPEAETQAFCKIFTMDMYSSVFVCGYEYIA